MDLIASVASQLGISAANAQGAVGSLLGLIKQHAPPDAAAALDDKVPEANQWIASAPAPDGGGGALGGLLGSAASALGGLGGIGETAGPMAALAGSLSKLGLGADSIGKLLPLVLQFLKARGGEGLVARLLSSVPFLSQLGGSAGGSGSPLGGLGGLFK
jgi:hypothetical protein